MMDINVDLLQWSINFLIKRLLVVVLKMIIFQAKNELKNCIIRKFKKRKIRSAFTNNIWGADLADIQLTNKFNKGFIDIYSKYA